GRGPGLPGPRKSPPGTGGPGGRPAGAIDMSDIPTCREVERDLVAVAAGEAGVAEARGVERHVAVCRECRDELGRYRVLEGMVTDLRSASVPGADPTLSRAELEARLADIRSRVVSYGVFP